MDEPARSTSRLALPSMPKMSVITSFFSTPTTASAPDSETNDVPATGMAMPSPTDSADPTFAFKHRSTQGSISDDLSETRSKKRVQRPRTAFSICHPPPKRTNSKRQVHIRAKPLLQFHKLETHARPKPAFEVLPSSIFSPRLTKAVNKVFGARHCLCPTDLAIVKAEEYHTHELAGSDEDESLDVIAIICGLGRKDAPTPGSAIKMIFADGSEWDGIRLTNGGYECSTSDDHGLKQTARWVYKKKVKAGDSDTRLDDPPADKKFKFSTISPSSRRHPVIASLCSTSLDIFDNYTQPSPTASSAQPSLSEDSPESEAIATTQQLRDLITASAVWVALCEHRSGNLRDLDTRSPSFKSISTSRSFTFSSPPASPSKRTHDDSSINTAPRSASLKQTFQRAPSLLRRQIMGARAASASNAAKSTPMPAAMAVETKTPQDGVPPASVRTRARADTTSTVLINENAAQWRPDFDDDVPDCEEGEESDGFEARPHQAPAGTTPSGQTSRTTSGSDGTMDEKGLPNTRMAHASQKRPRFMTKFLCGLV